MGYPLRREIRDALPPGLLTPAERIVLLELADCANDKTRLAYPGMELLTIRTDMSEDTVSKCLQRLAGKGLELRVAIGVDKIGRPVYAARGHQTTYRIPVLAKAGQEEDLCEQESPDPDPANEKGKAGHTAGKGRTTVRQRPDREHLKAGPGSGPSPQEPSRNTSKNSSERKTPAPSSPTSSGASRATKPETRNPERTDDGFADPWTEVASMTASGGGGLWPRTARSTSPSAQAPSSPTRADALRETRAPVTDIHTFGAVEIVQQVKELVPSLNRTELASIGHAYADRCRAGVRPGILGDSLRRAIRSECNDASALLTAIQSTAA